jgi:hypothetical protein
MPVTVTNRRTRRERITFDARGVHLRPVAQHCSWPSELDLMAGRAGLRLRERYAEWDRRPFGSNSTNHVSVYLPG